MVGKMIDIDRRYGPWTGRVWGLIFNFIGNAIAIYGAVGFIQNRSRAFWMITGIVITLICLLVLAMPTKDRP